MALLVVINGGERTLQHLVDGASLAEVVAGLQLKADRVAVERQGEIVPRDGWHEVRVHAGDRLEIVHFVGGGSCGAALLVQSDTVAVSAKRFRLHNVS
jgi:sulfur carrier protein